VLDARADFVTLVGHENLWRFALASKTGRFGSVKYIFARYRGSGGGDEGSEQALCALAAAAPRLPHLCILSLERPGSGLVSFFDSLPQGVWPRLRDLQILFATAVPEFPRITAAAPALESLSLCWQATEERVCAARTGAFARLDWRGLLSLSLGGTQLGRGAGAALAQAGAAGSFETVRALSLSETSLTTTDLAALFLARDAFPALETLMLDSLPKGTKVDTATMAAALPRLKYLNLSWSVGCGVEANWGGVWPRLEVLVLNGCDLGDVALEDLASASASGCLPGIVHLFLSRNARITCAGVTSLVGVAWPRLEYLALDGCGLSGTATRAVAAARDSGRLGSLNTLVCDS